MSLFKDLQSSSINLFEIWHDIDNTGQASYRKSGHVKGTDLQKWEAENSCQRGVDFTNLIKSAIDERRRTIISAGAHISTAKWAELEWKHDYKEPELVLKHSHQTNVIRLSKTFAEKMQWIPATNYEPWALGTNLKFSYHNHTRPTSELSDNEPSKLDGDWLNLSALSDWRFLNLNQSFRAALNLNPRPLEVTVKVTANQQTVTQRLGQVYYAPQGLQRYSFTPPQEQFEDVQEPHWEVIELTLKELDGTLANFQSDSQCVMMLHSKQF